MFEATVDWVGLVVAGAAVALRLYLRESEVSMYEMGPLEYAEWQADRARVREWCWLVKDELLDTLLLHDCGAEKDMRAVLRLAGLEPEQWILGALAGDRDVAER